MVTRYGDEMFNSSPFMVKIANNHWFFIII